MTRRPPVLDNQTINFMVEESLESYPTNFVRDLFEIIDDNEYGEYLEEHGIEETYSNGVMARWPNPMVRDDIDDPYFVC